MIEGQCLCGEVKFRFHGTPEYLNECNCGACRRYATLWAYGDHDTIEIEHGEMVVYFRNDKTLGFYSCAKCGCTTHWDGAEPGYRGRRAVNMRLAEPEDIKDIRIRHFDGRNTWTYLD